MMSYRQSVHWIKPLVVLTISALILCITQKPGASADNVRVAYSSPTATQGILWVADVGGLFKKNGLDVQVIYTRLAIESLVAGEIDFGQMTGALMSSARLQGTDPVMLAGVEGVLTDRLLARPNIKSIEELRGKRIGIFRFGAASHVRVLNVLPRYGLTDRDVTLLQIGDTPARLIALLAGSIDATLASPPDHQEAVRAGMRVLLNLTDLNVPYQGVGLVTTQRVLAKKRDVARRFVRAYIEAIHMIKTNPEVSKRAYAKYRKAKDEKEVEPAYETLREVVKPKPYPSVEGFKTILADLSERVPAAKVANPKDFIDVSLLEELDRSGFIDALYR
jgi:NitT/TauT family transport system substrate-binding protein